MEAQKKSSRLIVKNLPLDLDELSLKKHFSAYGRVTDCRIVFNGDKNRGFAFVGFSSSQDSEAARKALHQSYIGKQRIIVESVKPENKPVNFRPVEQEQLEEAQCDPLRLYAVNFPYDARDEEVYNALSANLKINSVRLLTDREGNCKGQGYLTFDNQVDTLYALEKLNDVEFMGRRLFVKRCKKSEKAEAAKQAAAAEVGKEQSSLKKMSKARLLERVGNPDTWSASFLNPNLVMERVAEKVGTSRRELLTESKAFPAVMQTLAEKEILDETIAFLSAPEVGVNVALFSEAPEKSERSDRIIIVKNLPVQATHSEVKVLLSRHGKVQRFYMTPNKAIAFAVFENSMHAKNAFTFVSAIKFKGSPLYLEWAPKNFLVEEEEEVLKKRSRPTSPVPSAPGAGDDGVQSSVVMVKNLSFAVSETDLQDLLNRRKLKGWKSIKIPKDPQGKSKGFGFIEFSSAESAQTAMKALSGELLQGRVIDLLFSVSNKERRDEKPEQKTDYANIDKLMLRNIAFQATKKELEELVSAIVRFKRVRLPTKEDGQARGFAFLEFDSPDDCKRAYAALRNLHFYGRRVVVEYAQQ